MLNATLTGKKMQIPVFWHSVRNLKPSVRSAGIISLFEQKEKGKKNKFYLVT